MTIHLRGFLDRYRALLMILVMLLCGAVAQAQYLQPIPNYGYQWKRGKFDSLWVGPQDTFAVPSSLQNVPWEARKGPKKFRWSISLLKWEEDGGSASVDSFTYATRRYVDSSVTALPYITQEQLDDSTEAIRADFPAGGGASSTTDLADVSDATPIPNGVLRYDGDSGVYVPTEVASFCWDNLRDGDEIYYDSTSNCWKNKRPSTGNGSVGGTLDSIRVLSSTPSAYPGFNAWFNDLNHHIYVRNGEGTYWVGYAPVDSLEIVAPGSGPQVETWGYTAALTTAADGLINTNASGHGYGRGNTSLTVSNYVEATIADATNTKDKMIGFGTAASPSALNQVLYGFLINNGNQLWKAEGGVYTNTSQTVATGNRIRVYFADASTVKLQKWDGSNWQDLASMTPAGSSYYTIVVAEGPNGALSNIKWE